MGLSGVLHATDNPATAARAPLPPAPRTLPVLHRGCKPSFSWRIGAPDLDRVRKDAPAASHRRWSSKRNGRTKLSGKGNSTGELRVRIGLRARVRRASLLVQ